MKKDDLEFVPLPDEYLQGEGGGISGKESDEHRLKRSCKRMLYMLAAGAVLFWGTVWGQGNPAGNTEQTQKTEASGKAQKQESGEKPDRTDVPEATAEPGETDAPGENTEGVGKEEYPLEDGVIRYVVYNDTYYYDQTTGSSGNQVLAEGEISAERLKAGENYSLPQPEEPEGFLFMGWVAYFNMEEDTYPKMKLQGESFTAEDAVLIKADAEGNRDVEIHAAWRTEASGNWPNLLLLDAGEGTIEGSNTVQYDTVTPMASGGYVYLCAYPVPERAGYEFTGWYQQTKNGEKRKEFLTGVQFFEVVNGEVDWNRTKEIVLTAGWKQQK